MGKVTHIGYAAPAGNPQAASSDGLRGGRARYGCSQRGTPM